LSVIAELCPGDLDMGSAAQSSSRWPEQVWP
jgi:hypothetical protein